MTFLTVVRQQMILHVLALLGRRQIAMQQVMQRRPKTMNPRPAPWRLRRQGFLEASVLRLALSVLAFLVVSAILDGKNLPAQTYAPQATKPVQQEKAAKSAAEATAVQPPASPAPIWPATQPPNQARVSWDSRGLEIEASNSSLNQVLHQVASATGAKLEGFTQDQRIFGSYGPGSACAVLSKLLDGSGYNVLMIGSCDADAPLEIVLSARSPASPQTASNQNRSNSEDREAGEQPKPEPQPDNPSEPSRPPPIQNPFGNGGPPRDPLQFMQEILQRQQQIDQQQQQQQKNNPQR